ncbi:MAG: hypothetical protein VW600_07645, partial [Ferrovibrio sp.]
PEEQTGFELLRKNSGPAERQVAEAQGEANSTGLDGQLSPAKPKLSLSHLSRSTGKGAHGHSSTRRARYMGEKGMDREALSPPQSEIEKACMRKTA